MTHSSVLPNMIGPNFSLSTLEFIYSFEFFAVKSISLATQNLSKNSTNSFILLYSLMATGYISNFGMWFLYCHISMRFHPFAISFDIASSMYALCILYYLWSPLFKYLSTSFIFVSSYNGIVEKLHTIWRLHFNE